MPSLPATAAAPGMLNMFIPPQVPADSGPTSFLSAHEGGNYEVI